MCITNEQAPPCVHFDDYCMPESWHKRACFRYLGGRGSSGTPQRKKSVRRRQVTGAERTSDASPASGAPTCASHRMRQRIPAQCARGGPATPADGYFSLLCGNCTGTVPNSQLTTLLCRWMACVQSRETRTMHRAACDTHVQPAMRSKHHVGCAGWHRGVLKGYSGVLRGTQGVLGSLIECMRAHRTGTMLRAACGTHVQPAMRSMHRGRRRAGWH